MNNEERILELLHVMSTVIEHGEVFYEEEYLEAFKEDVKELYELVKDMKVIECD